MWMVEVIADGETAGQVREEEKANRDEQNARFEVLCPASPPSPAQLYWTRPLPELRFS
jgi:hypothetical protein